MRQEQVDEGDGDGREVLKNQFDHPLVGSLGDAGSKPPKVTRNLRKTLVKCANPQTHLFHAGIDGKEDEVEGSAQQTQDEHVQEEPQQVEPHLLPQLPLSYAHGEPLLLEEQLGEKHGDSVELMLSVAMRVQLPCRPRLP